MTLIVGMICKRAIVVAADSQTSYGITKIPGTNKITEVIFRNRKSVIIAEAGMVVLGGQVVSIFSQKAAATDFKNHETVSTLLREAMMEVRQQQMALYPAYKLEDWKTYFRDDSPVELTAAYYDYADKPYLFTMSLDECVARFTKGHSASGIGRDFGNYLFAEHFRPNMEDDLGLAILVKIVRDAAAFVEGCGTPIKAAIVQQPSVPPWEILAQINKPNPISTPVYIPEVVSILSDSQIESTLRMLKRIDTKTADARINFMHRAIQAESTKQFQKMFPGYTRHKFPKT